MDTYIAYFDETGDDGITTASSSFFVLTSLYMSTENWQSNFDKIKTFRKQLRDTYGFHVAEELHTKHLLSDKDPYRKYRWTEDQRKDIVMDVAKCITGLDAKIVNVIIDKTHIQKPDYPVLTNALKYNIQRIENDSAGNWNYIIITDKGRLAPMRTTAREIRAYNPIPSKYSYDYTNQPVRNLIEDILEKDSRESYFIQICDFVSYIVHLYYKTQIKEEVLPNRVGRVIDNTIPKKLLEILRQGEILNLKATRNNEFGIVIYPK
ncbi:MAG: DUF3800 domain-containing protein [Bacteroides thetaiotaomicron]|nr:DUF3800 domain-containing protein [Bacteroides thetaiotaomicron]